jgi:hypothetical protein
MAEEASLESLPRQVLAKILSPLDSRDLTKFELALRDPQIAEEASWEALREIASRCDSPGAFASFGKMAGEPLKLCVDAVRRIVKAFDDANEEREGHRAYVEGDRAYVMPPEQTIPDLDEPIDYMDYMELMSFVLRDVTAYADAHSLREKRELNHKDMRKWNDMLAEGGFWTKAPGKLDIACWLLFGTPCEHLTRVFAPDSETADREDAFRELFAGQARECVHFAASGYRDLLKETPRELRVLAVPRVVVVTRRLAKYGFFEEASALLRATLFDDAGDVAVGSEALTNELYVFLTELKCEAMYAGTFVEPFMGEEDFRAFANVVRVARLALDRTTEEFENATTEDAVGQEKRGGPLRGVAARVGDLLFSGNSQRRKRRVRFPDIPRANDRTFLAVASVLTPEYRASLNDIKIRYLEKKKRAAETRWTESSGRDPETLESPYAHVVDRLAAAQHAYGRILGLAHQQKHMQNDFAEYPEVAAEIIPPTFIWPNHGEHLFRGKTMDVYGRASVRNSCYLRSNMEDFRGAATSSAAVAEVLFCAASVKINGAMREDDVGNEVAARAFLEEAVETSLSCVRCFRDAMNFFDRGQKELAESALSRERGGEEETHDSVKRIVRLETSDAVAANGFPLLDAKLYVIAKDFGKTLRFVDSHVAAAASSVDAEEFEMAPNDNPRRPWVPWELMDENGVVRVGSRLPNWTPAAEGEQWLLLAYACAAEKHGPFHAHARNVERMFAMHTPRVTPEEVRVRARAVARGYRADFKARLAESPDDDVLCIDVNA